MPSPEPSSVGSPADEGLVRAIGVRALAASTLNCIVGAGIFVLPAVAAQGLGAAGILSYVVCAVAMGLVILCFAAAGSRISSSGGMYAYTEVAFGPLAGFVVGAVNWFTAGVIASASVANALVGAMAEVTPLFATPLGRTSLIFGVYTAFAIINVRGVRAGAHLIEGITIAKLLPLITLAGVGIFFIRPERLAWHGPVTLSAIGQSAILVIFAFSGTEVAVTPGGELRNPSRTLPRGILLALGLSTALYLALQETAQGVLGDQLATETRAPLAAAAQAVFGNGGKALLLFAGIVSMIGYLSTDALATPRMLFAFGRDGIGPRALSAIHPRFRTPYVAIIVHQGLSALFAVTGSFRSLLILANVGALIVYFGVCLASIELDRRDVRADGPPFRLPGGPTIPLLACVVVIWLATNAAAADALAAGAVVLSAIAIFGLNRLLRGRAGAEPALITSPPGSAPVPRHPAAPTPPQPRD